METLNEKKRRHVLAKTEYVKSYLETHYAYVEEYLNAHTAPSHPADCQYNPLQIMRNRRLRHHKQQKDLLKKWIVSDQLNPEILKQGHFKRSFDGVNRLPVHRITSGDGWKKVKVASRHFGNGRLIWLIHLHEIVGDLYWRMQEGWSLLEGPNGEPLVAPISIPSTNSHASMIRNSEYEISKRKLPVIKVDSRISDQSEPASGNSRSSSIETDTHASLSAHIAFSQFELTEEQQKRQQQQQLRHHLLPLMMT
ncbi:hypothetical protein DAMA08_036890 [Martiniozyma asiatica (nom. inval.)]|nr:hypothetical protein DAMA08_036890 [Martiniozyma asiatica]